MSVEYPHVRKIALPLVADTDPNVTQPPSREVFDLRARPDFGPTTRGGVTLSHALYLSFEDASGADLGPTGEITFNAWEQDGSNRSWVKIQEATQTLKRRIKILGSGVQEARLFLQLLTVVGAPVGAVQFTLHATEQATEEDPGYGANIILGTVVANQGTTPWIVADQPAVTPAVTDVPASAVPVVLLAANAARLSLTIYNDSNRPLTVKAGLAPTATSRTAIVPPKMEWFPDVRYTGVITGFWSAGATGSAAVTEYTP